MVYEALGDTLKIDLLACSLSCGLERYPLSCGLERYPLSCGLGLRVNTWHSLSCASE